MELTPEPDSDLLAVPWRMRPPMGWRTQWQLSVSRLWALGWRPSPNVRAGPGNLHRTISGVSA